MGGMGTGHLRTCGFLVSDRRLLRGGAVRGRLESRGRRRETAGILRPGSQTMWIRDRGARGSESGAPAVRFAETTLPGEGSGRVAVCNVGGCGQVSSHIPGCPGGSWAVTGQREGWAEI